MVTSETEENSILEQLIREAADQAARDWAEPEKLLETLLEVNGRRVRSGRHELAVGVLRLLAQDYGKDVIGRIAEEAERDQRREKSDWGFRVLFDAFCEILPELYFDIAALVDALHAAFLTKAFVGTVYKSIENLSRRSRETAELLLRTFAAHSDSPMVDLVSNVLLGLAHFDPREAHGRALSMTYGETLALRRAALAVLGLFRYSDAEGDLVKLTLGRLRELKAASNPEMDDLLVKVYGDLTDLVEEARRAIPELAKRPAPVVQSAVAYFLYRRAEADHRHEWYREALLSLASVATAQGETLDLLDHCVAVCAREDLAFASEFVEAFVKSRDYGREGDEAKIAEILTDTLVVMYREASALEAMMTRWWASSDQRLHQAAWDLAGQGHFGDPGSNLPVLELSKPVLDSLSEQAVRLIVERVLGYAIFGRPQTALIASVLHREPLTPSVAGLVEEALGDVLYNYPNSAEKYLRSRFAREETREIEQEVIERALARSDAYFAALRDRPRLAELRPPSNRLARFWRAQQKGYGKIWESARKESVLMSLMPSVHLKFGGSFFTETDGAFTEPAVLGSTSYFSENARGDSIDPLGQMYLRMRRRAAGLRAAREEEEP